MNPIELHPIGTIEPDGKGAKIVLAPAFAEGLEGLRGYGHVQVLWWMDRCDDPATRSVLVERKPYVRGPEELGVFALRSPERPNPVALSTAEIVSVDEEAGTVSLAWLDAFPGSAVLDLKPYTPSLDRVERPVVPDWCRHWPRSCEASGAFDWAREFAF
ncbi:MAG: SAM-dependent methyltransferase [Kiritimatiellae bacterium]|nr:SAM-dependent methyltransferase [Kiritimatiellia bacterium]